LIFYLHGLGNDHRQFSDAILQLPFRAISLSLFGFDNKAQLRPPITMHDHTILLHAVMKDVCSHLQPRQVVLVGFSSGADHVLQCISSDIFSDFPITGLLSLGCNIHIDYCFASSKMAQLTSGDDKQILTTINQFGTSFSTLSDWLILHGYLVTAFSKFGTHTDALSRYSDDIISPFKDGSLTQFPKWYKCCTKRVPHVRFIFDTDGFDGLDRLMQKHLEDNIVGDDFDEDTIVRIPFSHMELGQPENIYKYTLEFMEYINSKQN
jgi:hypothetical protein